MSYWEKEYTDGFAKVDAFKAAQAEAKATAKTVLLERLGINEDEAKLLLS